MPCSICRFPGHNCSTCIWKNLHKSNADFQEYIFTEDFYLSSIKELIILIYNCDNQINNLQDYIFTIKDRIENYTVFKKKNYYVKSKEEDCVCVICMDECKNAKSCYQCNVCNIVLHQSCIDSWFKNNKKTCPACHADWGEKAKAPWSLINRYDNCVQMFENKVSYFNKLQTCMIDTLARYYNTVDSKDINNDIISYVPTYMNDKSLEIANQIDMTVRPIMSNGDKNLLNY